MKITAQEEYGLRCLLHLARTRDPLGQNIREIAEAENLSIPYVAKLLAVLRRAGLITSVRGRKGGYLLARPAGDIRLGEVMQALGGPLHIRRLTDSEAKTPFDCYHYRIIYQTAHNLKHPKTAAP